MDPQHATAADQRSGDQRGHQFLINAGPDIMEVTRAAKEGSSYGYEAPCRGIEDRPGFGLSYAEIAESIGSPSEDAARMLVRRGVDDVARRMKRGSERA